MTRTFYDAVTASNIPLDAAGVCGYVDGLGLWSPSDWARFPNAVKVYISSLGTNDGQVLDVEPGNPNAVQSVDWILQRRAAGVDPYTYTAEWAPGYTWADVRSACDARGVPYPHWWKAPGARGQVGSWNGSEPLMVQYAYPGPYDLNEVADFLPGIENVPIPGPVPVGVDPEEESDMLSYSLPNGQVATAWVDGGGNLMQKVYTTAGLQQTNCLNSASGAGPGPAADAYVLNPDRGITALVGLFGDATRQDVFGIVDKTGAQFHWWYDSTGAHAELT